MSLPPVLGPPNPFDTEGGSNDVALRQIEKVLSRWPSRLLQARAQAQLQEAREQCFQSSYRTKNRGQREIELIKNGLHL